MEKCLSRSYMSMSHILCKCDHRWPERIVFQEKPKLLRACVHVVCLLQSVMVARRFKVYIFNLNSSFCEWHFARILAIWTFSGIKTANKTAAARYFLCPYLICTQL